MKTQLAYPSGSRVVHCFVAGRNAQPLNQGGGT
jgi:hypothetical protein